MQKKEEEEEKRNDEQEIVVEDPDQIDASKLERIGPHEVIRSLLELFKSNGRDGEVVLPQ